MPGAALYSQRLPTHCAHVAHTARLLFYPPDFLPPAVPTDSYNPEKPFQGVVQPQQFANTVFNSSL